MSADKPARKTRVFVSAKGSGGARIREMLRLVGFDVPSGHDHSGFASAHELEAALRACDVVVVVCDGAESSVGVGIEMALAYNASIPVLLTGCLRPPTWAEFWWTWGVLHMAPPGHALNEAIESLLSSKEST